MGSSGAVLYIESESNFTSSDDLFVDNTGLVVGGAIFITSSSWF